MLAFPRTHCADGMFGELQALQEGEHIAFDKVFVANCHLVNIAK